jgi:hypothetical protein
MQGIAASAAMQGWGIAPVSNNNLATSVLETVVLVAASSAVAVCAMKNGTSANMIGLHWLDPTTVRILNVQLPTPTEQCALDQYPPVSTPIRDAQNALVGHARIAQ